MRFNDTLDVRLRSSGKEIFSTWSNTITVTVKAEIYTYSGNIIAMEAWLCDQHFLDNDPMKAGYTSLKLQKKLINGHEDCKSSEEFLLKVWLSQNYGKPDRNMDIFVSLVNFTLIVAHGELQMPVALNDKENFLFTVDNQTIPDHTKLFTPAYYPPVSEEIEDYFVRPEFNDTSEFKMMELDMDAIYNGSDYCLDFQYYNVDNQAALSVVSNSSDFRFDLYNLPETYYEEALTSYAWKVIRGMCMRSFFGVRRGVFPEHFYAKLLPTGVHSDANVFAVGRMNVLERKFMEPGPFLVAWKAGGKDANDNLQWMHVQHVNHMKLDTYSPELTLTITTKQQSRPVSFYMNSCLLTYESASTLRFMVKNELPECLIKTEFVDVSNRVMKTDIRKFQPTKDATEVEVRFNDADAVGLNKTNKWFRIHFTFTVPKKPEKKEDKAGPTEKQDAQKDQSLQMWGLTFNDPCRSDSCRNGGRCVPKSSHEFGCICQSKFTGDRCDFPNRCTGPLNDTTKLTGDEYCKTFGENVKCSPLNNVFECVCQENEYWNQMQCKKMDECSFRVCGLNEMCGLNVTTNITDCVCRYDYKWNSTTGRCEPDPCGNKAVCETTQDCISVTGKPWGECDCKPGWSTDEVGCEDVRGDNPFAKQALNCEHTIKKDTIRYGEYYPLCDCFAGYELAEDQQRCRKKVHFKDEECVDMCNPNKQVCVKESVSGKAKCRCKLGFSSENCVNNICEEKDESGSIERLCGTGGCRVNTRNESDYRFECKCNPNYSYLNTTTGFCELLDPCTEEKQKRCEKVSAVCVPIVKMVKSEKEVSSECVCPFGRAFDAQGRCTDSCKAKCFGNELKTQCDFDVITSQTNCSCRAGYLQDPDGEQCLVSTDLVSMTVHMVMRTNATFVVGGLNQEFESYTVPNNFFLDVCKMLSFRRNCLNKYSEVYRRLYYDQIDNHLIDRHIKSQIRFQLRQGFRNVVRQGLFDLWVLSYQNLTPIDYLQYGYKTNFTVDLLLASRFDEHAEVSLVEQLSQKRLKENCFRSDSNVSLTDDSGEQSECVVPPHLMLFDLNIIKPVREDPCKLGLIECPAYSKCTRQPNGDKSFTTRCTCNPGFIQREFEMQHSGVEFPSLCQDQDECANDEYKNFCDIRTTTCENTPGSYKCNCLENYRRVNAFSCDSEFWILILSILLI